MKTPKDNNNFIWTTKCKMAITLTAVLIIIYTLALIAADSHKDAWWHKLVTNLIPNLLSPLIAFIAIYWFLNNNDKEQVDSEIIREIADLATRNNTLLEQHFDPSDIYCTYTAGEKDAMQLLTKSTNESLTSVKSTRFFPKAIKSNHPEYANAIHNAVMGNENHDPVRHAINKYERIICANNRDKIQDINDYINLFGGENFYLWITTFANDFELVIIDDEQLFIHFGGKKKIIDSTLHIKDKTVCMQFAEIYDNFKTTTPDYPVLPINLKEIDSAEKKLKAIDDVLVFFNKNLPL